MNVLFLGLLLSFVFGSPFTNGRSQDNLPPLPGLAKGCALELRQISIAEEGIFLRCQRVRFRIYHPKNLYEHIVIENAAAALSFARFFSSRRTFSIIGMSGDVELGVSRQSMDDYVIQRGSSLPGPIEVKQYDDAIEGRIYVITRYVVALDQGVYKLTERVTEQGNYDLIERTMIEKDAGKFGVIHIGKH